MSEQNDNRESEDPAVVVERPAGWFSNAPWWMVSAGLHLVLLLGATLVAIERMRSFDADGEQILVQAAPPPLFTDLPQPAATTGKNSAPIDDAAATMAQPTFFDPNAAVGDWEESDDGEQRPPRPFIHCGHLSQAEACS